MKLLRLLPVFMLGLLTACSGGGHQDLIQYMQEVHQRPSRPIEPVPTFAEYHSFAYSAAGRRSPFDPPVEITLVDTNFSGKHADVKPDPTRPKEYLENFNISAIKMVGTIAKNSQLWALVNDGTGNIHRVHEGNYMGRNHGRIVGITNTQVNVVEIVPDGGSGWIERPQIIKLTEGKE